MVRLTRLRSVDMNAMTWPSRLCAARPLRWTPANRFAKFGTVVTELYSRHLALGEPVLALTWWVRFIPTEHLTGTTFGDVAWSVADGNGEVHDVPFSPAVVDLPDMQRRLAILDFLQGHLLALGAKRGWPRQPFEDAYRACMADELELTLVGKAKSSPDRRLRIRPQFTIDGNGDGWTSVEYIDRGGRVIGRSQPFDSPPEIHRFRRIEQSLRWDDHTTVSLVPWDDVGPSDWEGKRRIIQAPTT